RGVQNFFLLDVRTDSERQLGTIRGSVHIPLHHIVRRIEELEKHKAKEIICFCQTGNRSVSAALLLKRRGFKVANLVGGMAEWNFSHRAQNKG
ncbi:MAG: rhodanese-like domain-containing protein, partial [Ignavibacteriales bacterium]|nr:rhodanese-like domain-containing protein [Ignavibacteriales bacterium]